MSSPESSGGIAPEPMLRPRKDTPEDVFAMVSSGRLEDLRRLVRRNQVDVGRVRDALDRGALHMAVVKNQIPTIRYLISSVDGVDVNAYDKHKQSVFHYAAHTGDTDVLQLLHAKGASLGYRDVFGRNALHHAAMHGSVSAVRWLMDNALSRHDVLYTWLNETDKIGSNALHWAAVKGKLDMAMFLVARGIDVHLSVGAKKRPYNLAKDAGRDSCYTFLRGYITAGERLRDYCRKRMQIQEDGSELDGAAKGGDDSGAGSGGSRLTRSVSSSSVTADVEFDQASYRPAAMGPGASVHQVEEELAEHVKAFEVWKASARANGCFYQFYRSRQGLTALHEAAKAGDYIVLSLLVKKYKFSVVALDHYRRTPLHYAALHGHSEIAMWLAHLPKCPREEETYSQFLKGNLSNGLNLDKGDHEDDEEGEEQVRVSHWKLETSTKLTPSQMAAHGYEQRLHRDATLSKRLARCEKGHESSVREYKQAQTNERLRKRRESKAFIQQQQQQQQQQPVQQTQQQQQQQEQPQISQRQPENHGNMQQDLAGDGQSPNEPEEDKKAPIVATGGPILQSESKTGDESRNNMGGAHKSGEPSGSAGANKNKDVLRKQTQLENNNHDENNNNDSAAATAYGTDAKTNGQGVELTPVEVGRRDVKVWMGSINMEEYIECFFENGWDTPAALQEMKEKDLEEMGVKSGHKALIMKNIRARRGVLSELFLTESSEPTPNNDPLRSSSGLDRLAPSRNTSPTSQETSLEASAQHAQQLQSMPTVEFDSRSQSLPNFDSMPAAKGSSSAVAGNPLSRSISFGDGTSGTATIPLAGDGGAIDSASSLISSTISVDTDASDSPVAISRSSSEADPDRAPILAGATGATSAEVSQESIQIFENSELKTEENDKMDGRNTRRAMWESMHVVVKRLDSKMLARVQECEKQLLRCMHPGVLPFLGICLDPPSLLTLHMSHGTLAKHLYGKGRCASNPSGISAAGAAGTVGGAAVAAADGSREGDAAEGGASAGCVDDEAKMSGTIRNSDGLIVKVNGEVTDMCVCRWATQMASAISRLHAEKIIHGDISCRNALLDANYNVKITDYLVHDPEEDYALASQSLHWEAPEALAGEVDGYTSKTDAYSFAMTLYEMAIRGKPWGERTNSEVRREVSEGSRPPLMPLQEWSDGFEGTDSWISVVKKSWDPAPERRMEVWKMSEVLARTYEECQMYEARKQRKETKEKEEEGAEDAAAVGSAEQTSGGSGSD